MKQLPGLGRLPDPPDNRDHHWRALRPQALELPTSHFVKYRGRVLDQGQTPRCVAYSSAHLKLQQEFAEHRHYYRFDPDELYARCKERDGIPGEDGTYLRVALAIIRDRGLLAQRRRKQVGFTIDEYVRLNTLDEIKEAVLTVGPVLIGMSVDAGIFRPNEAGVLDAPTGNPIGGHAMLIVGWDDHKHAAGCLELKNSWGESYGRGGFMSMPYSWLTTYGDWDAWRSLDKREGVNA